MISAKQAALTSNEKVENIFVPIRGVGDNSQGALYHEIARIYQKFTRSPNLIRFSATVEEMCSRPYNMDEKDILWLEDWNVKRLVDCKLSQDAFEECVYWLEMASQKKVLINN